LELRENETLEDAYVSNQRVREQVDERYEDLVQMREEGGKEWTEALEEELDNLEAMKEGKTAESMLESDMKKLEII
jgi:hypothetical protein